MDGIIVGKHHGKTQGFYLVPVERTPGVGGIPVVIITKSLADVLGQLGTVVKRHGREEMMGNMVMRDLFFYNLVFKVATSGMTVQTHVVQEETSHPTHEGTVYSRSGAAEESEGIVAEMGHGGVGVVKVSEHDDPVVGKCIRNEVILEERRE